MLESLKVLRNKSIAAAFEIVYLITFKDKSHIPQVTKEIKSLAKWYITSGEEWYCHSDDSLEEFKKKFLTLTSLTEEQVIFSQDHLPFSK
ncbi:Uncharacterised protein [Streptococcus criceti]|uniref:Uncharacterized protein n=1 Tax=Streptococcus criceti HS-6 TaxID=873449 RepID=G5JMI2_STRCG|nr:DUF3884 family protein [Streptococcus criceti]EHI73825.1 hypothetical protein STRCR_1244 [Streptococcus criceti HS-6]SUN37808.1 Uncharacterised protein [Streptococcus criceti]